MKKFFIITIACLIAGCQNDRTSSKTPDIKSLQQENKLLSNQLNQCNLQAAQLKQQVENLTSIRASVKAQDIYNLQQIKISRFTNFYDDDNDGKKENLTVYFHPADDCGDSIKAAGSVEVQLWDLSKEGDNALLAVWKKDSVELKKLWFTGLLGPNYRLIFDVKDKIEMLDKPLTLKVAFTDYLTGRTFTEQKVIKP
jgi:hypothetical protein